VDVADAIRIITTVVVLALVGFVLIDWLTYKHRKIKPKARRRREPLNRAATKPFTINSIDVRGDCLFIVCSGEFGVGSEGNPSADLIVETAVQWMDTHPDSSLTHAVIDFTDVDYYWGNGPTSAAARIGRRGLRSITIKSNDTNREPLENLLRRTGLDRSIHLA
jgi:hypothetical protein